MSNNTVTLTVTPEQAEVLQGLLGLVAEPEAPAGDRCAATRKDGEPCQGKVVPGWDVCVAHTKKAPKAEPKPKAKKAPKADKAATKERNRALAAALRKQGVQPNGDVWLAAKTLAKTHDVTEAARLAIVARS